LSFSPPTVANGRSRIRPRPLPFASSCLPQQVENALLGRVRLRQSRDTGLVQDGEAGEIGDFGRDVRRADAVFGASQVLNLVVDDVDRRLQTVDARADRTTDARD